MSRLYLTTESVVFHAAQIKPLGEHSTDPSVVMIAGDVEIKIMFTYDHQLIAFCEAHNIPYFDFRERK